MVGISALRPVDPMLTIGSLVSPTRLYFDLGDSEYSVPDVNGIEVSDLEEARRAALETIHRLRQEHPSVAQDWSGWTLRVVDTSGSVVFSIPLDSIVS
jgi:hypothetical protein